MIVVRYLRGWFIFDIMACLPILVFEMKHGFTTNEEEVRELIDSNIYFILFLLKIFKLGMLMRIDSVIQNITTRIEDVLPHVNKTLFVNVVRTIRVTLLFLLWSHWYACGWIAFRS